MLKLTTGKKEFALDDSHFSNNLRRGKIKCRMVTENFDLETGTGTKNKNKRSTLSKCHH
jgi:hypothetical protein